MTTIICDHERCNNSASTTVYLVDLSHTMRVCNIHREQLTAQGWAEYE